MVDQVTLHERMYGAKWVLRSILIPIGLIFLVPVFLEKSIRWYYALEESRLSQALNILGAIGLGYLVLALLLYWPTDWLIRRYANRER